MDTCIFCKIASGDIPASKVYEDDVAVAFIDLHPLNPGHTIVIPKEHSSTFLDMSSSAYGVLMERVHTIAEKVHTAFPTTRLSVLIKGFDVAHTHVHLIPLNEDAELVFSKHSGLPPEAPREAREEMAEKIKNA